MPLVEQGVLAIWNGITSEGEEDFLRWHNTEHIPERVGVPGFLRGRRYVHATRPREYFTLYETESVETIRSAPYLARLNAPTPWTRRVLPHFRDTMRVGCRILSSVGHGQGGAILTVRLWPSSGREQGLQTWLTGSELGDVRGVTGIVGIHVLVPVAETTRIDTAEKRLRGSQPAEGQPADPWIVLVEATDAEVADALMRGPLAPEPLAGAGAEAGATCGVYRLQLTLDAAREDRRSP